MKCVAVISLLLLASACCSAQVVRGGGEFKCKAAQAGFKGNLIIF